MIRDQHVLYRAMRIFLGYIRGRFISVQVQHPRNTTVLLTLHFTEMITFLRKRSVSELFKLQPFHTWALGTSRLQQEPDCLPAGLVSLGSPADRFNNLNSTAFEPHS